MATATLCRVCGEPIVREPGKKGRPLSAHPACRANPKSHQRISPPQSARSETRPKALRSVHKFKHDPHPAAWRWCALCGRDRSVHEETR